MGGASSLFEARNISKFLGHVNALMDVSFEVRRHEVVGLLGDNESRQVHVDQDPVGGCDARQRGVPPRRRADRHRNPPPSEAAGIQTIYQDIALVRSMSVMRNIYAGREPTGPLGFLRMGEMRATTMRILDSYVRIAGITSPDLLVEDLSGGQAQAVAIARAVHFKRDILLLDEPTSALSVRETEKVLGIMRDIAEGGASCVFVTHNLYHAFKVCDRFMVMAHGRAVKSVVKAETSLNELTDLIMTH